MDALWNALKLPIAASFLAAVACGIAGATCAVRRSSYVAGAISHSCFAGIGLARFLAAVCGFAWATPTFGAFVAALAAGLFLALWPAARGRGADGALSGVWAVGMALGLLFMAATPGYQSDLSTWLFGSILFVSGGDIADMAAFDAVLFAVAFAFRRGILAVSFDERLAALRGEPVKAWNVAICAATAVAVVLLVRVVGIVLAVAMMSLPAAAARVLARRLSTMMLLTGLFAFLSLLAGIAASGFFDVPPSAPTVLCAFAIRIAASMTHRTGSKKLREKTDA